MKFKRKIAVLLAVSCLSVFTGTFNTYAADDEMIAKYEKQIAELQEELAAKDAYIEKAEKRYEELARANHSSDYRKIEDLEYQLMAVKENMSYATSEYQKQLEAYEAEINELNKKLEDAVSVYKNQIARLDVTGNDVVDAADASLVLRIYAYNSTNSKQLVTFDDLKAKGFIK